MSNIRLMRKRQVMDTSGPGRTQLAEWIKAKIFPQPTAYLGPKLPVWDERIVQLWNTLVIALGRVPTAEQWAACVARHEADTGERFAVGIEPGTEAMTALTMARQRSRAQCRTFPGAA